MFVRTFFTVSLLSMSSAAFGQTPRPTAPVQPAIVVTPGIPGSAAQMVEMSRSQAANAARLRGFSIVLVGAGVSERRTTEILAPAAAKAIADLKDFLPYKSYSQADTQWILGSGALKTRLEIPNKAYDVELEVTVGPGASQMLKVDHFVVRESPSGSQVAADISALRDNLGTHGLRAAELGYQAAMVTLQETKTRFEKGLVSREEVVRAELAGSLARNAVDSAKEQVAAARTVRPSPATLIDSSFRMDIGETLVVGTSKIDGYSALIFLLTAVAK